MSMLLVKFRDHTITSPCSQAWSAGGAHCLACPAPPQARRPALCEAWHRSAPSSCAQCVDQRQKHRVCAPALVRLGRRVLGKGLSADKVATVGHGGVKRHGAPQQTCMACSTTCPLPAGRHPVLPCVVISASYAHSIQQHTCLWCPMARVCRRARLAACECPPKLGQCGELETFCAFVICKPSCRAVLRQCASFLVHP